MSKVQNNVMASRYELFADGEMVLALRYRMERGQIWMLSLEIPASSMTPKNVEAFLIQVFQDAHRRRLQVLPFCPAVRNFVVQNPAYLRLLPKETPGHFPDLHQAAAVQQRRKKTLRTAVPQQKATAGKPARGLGASLPFAPSPDQNELHLAS